MTMPNAEETEILPPMTENYQGKEMLTTIQAPTMEDLDDMLDGMREYAESEGLGEFTVLEKGEDPDGGFRAVISAHNWNPFTWTKEKLEELRKRRYEKKRKKERETYAAVKPYVSPKTDTIDVGKAIGGGVSAKTLRRAGVSRTEIKGITPPKEPRKKSGGIGAIFGRFTGGAARGAEKVEGGLGTVIGTGVSGVVTAEKTGEEAIGAAGGMVEGILIPPEEAEAEQEITYGDRIAYSIGTVVRDGKYVAAWRVVKMPYKSIDDTEIATDILPFGVKEVSGIGTAYKTVEDLAGSPPVDLFIRLKGADAQEGISESPSGMSAPEGMTTVKSYIRRKSPASQKETSPTLKAVF